MSLLYMSLIVLKHAPYDAMVLVSNGYFVDQELRACGGVWKVRLRLRIFAYVIFYARMCMLKLLYDSQGSEVVREMPVPEELIFTVDERVRRDIALAKEQYTKSVSNTHTHKLYYYWVFVIQSQNATWFLVWISRRLYLQSQDLQVVSYAFTSFGKAAIKKRKLHPDTFVQLALQLAYYRLHGK